ncbi:MAG: 4-hydroxy-tetrahydrodipicolinate synthase [Bacteroidetes bacterium]|jgi:4-hydroxy-tetrahydrodipicolinate synthase|nr:4-hydroxy-tetrahydrodipicolinate synthase [Bacteroidota bacterium]
MNNKIDLTGTGVALATPFNKSQDVDYTALEKLINHVIKGKVEYLVVLGTTGETPVLSKSEKKEIIQFIKEKTNGQIPIVLGIGGNNTNEVLADLKNMDLEGIAAILSVAPYYNKPSQEGLYLHFSAIAKECTLPIILYNVPGRTGSNIKAKTTLRLANEYSNIAAVKEASGDLTQIMEIIAKKPGGFKVLSGDDALTYSIIMLGGDGVISVTANAFPYEFSEMVRQALAGNKQQALEFHYKLVPVMKLFFEEGSPTGLKAALNQLGIMENILRLPLVCGSDKLYQKIKDEIKRLL